MTIAIAILNGLRAHADDRGIDPALIDHVETWLTTFQQECNATWREPDQIFYDDAEKHIEFTWRGARDITIEVAMHTTGYIKSWGTDISDFEVGPLTMPQERIGLWRWLREGA